MKKVTKALLICSTLTLVMGCDNKKEEEDPFKLNEYGNEVELNEFKTAFENAIKTNVFASFDIENDNMFDFELSFFNREQENQCYYDELGDYDELLISFNANALVYLDADKLTVHQIGTVDGVESGYLGSEAAHEIVDLYKLSSEDKKTLYEVEMNRNAYSIENTFETSAEAEICFKENAFSSIIETGTHKIFEMNGFVEDYPSICKTYINESTYTLICDGETIIKDHFEIYDRRIYQVTFNSDYLKINKYREYSDINVEYKDKSTYVKEEGYIYNKKDVTLEDIDLSNLRLIED